MATLLGIYSLAALGIVVFRAYQSGGEALQGYGVTGILATLFSLTRTGTGYCDCPGQKQLSDFPGFGNPFEFSGSGGSQPDFICGSEFVRSAVKNKRAGK